MTARPLRRPDRPSHSSARERSAWPASLAILGHGALLGAATPGTEANIDIGTVLLTGRQSIWSSKVTPSRSTSSRS